MKISMLVDDLSIKGGYQKLVLKLSKQLEKFGHNVIIYTPITNKNNCYPEIWSNLKVKSIINTNDISLRATTIDKIKKVIYYFLLTIKFSKSDVIIIHDPMSLIALNFINTKRTKVLWMLNHQLPHYLQKDKKINNENNAVNLNLIKKYIKKLFAIIIKSNLKKIDLILTYDSYNNDLIKNNLTNNSLIIYAGADIEEKIIDDKIIKNQIQLLSIGVLFEYRRYEDIIDAINILNKEGIDCTLKIVGEVNFSLEYLTFLKKLIKDYNLDNKIFFCGAISNKDIDRIYRESDVFLFVNNAFTWGISVFEAMSYKLPIIVTNNIGAVDLLKNENCAFIVPPKSPQNIVEVIKKIKNDTEKIKIMINRYDKVLEKVSWSSFAKRMEDVINSVKK